ncbi:hypothetical protein BC831DRAFT_124206 [Entophlyctis helioformis]|nr:hypothetical protein BC831DRAFT_124206 [Entophlyctis helioformis]
MMLHDGLPPLSMTQSPEASFLNSNANNNGAGGNTLLPQIPGNPSQSHGGSIGTSANPNGSESLTIGHTMGVAMPMGVGTAFVPPGGPFPLEALGPIDSNDSIYDYRHHDDILQNHYVRVQQTLMDSVDKKVAEIQCQLKENQVLLKRTEDDKITVGEALYQAKSEVGKLNTALATT